MTVSSRHAPTFRGWSAGRRITNSPRSSPVVQNASLASRHACMSEISRASSSITIKASRAELTATGRLAEAGWLQKWWASSPDPPGSSLAGALLYRGTIPLAGHGQPAAVSQLSITAAVSESRGEEALYQPACRQDVASRAAEYVRRSQYACFRRAGSLAAFTTISRASLLHGYWLYQKRQFEASRLRH